MTLPQQKKYKVRLLLDHEDVVEITIYSYSPESAAETGKAAYEFDDHAVEVMEVWEE